MMNQDEATAALHRVAAIMDEAMRAVREIVPDCAALCQVGMPFAEKGKDTAAGLMYCNGVGDIRHLHLLAHSGIQFTRGRAREMGTSPADLDAGQVVAEASVFVTPPPPKSNPSAN